jgi:predicted phosphodiesterase
LELEFDSLLIAVTHKPVNAMVFGQMEKYDFVFYGHDHKPWQRNIGRTELLNPGNIQGTRYPATFAIFDTTKKGAQLFQIT